MKVNFEFLNKLVGILGSMVVLLFLTSCMDDEEPTPLAYVSIFHASPDAPDLDVVVDGRLAFNQPLEYTDYTSYNQFFTGNRALEFSPYNANNVLLDTTYNFQANKAYSLFVVGEESNLSALIVEDQADEPDEGNALVRLVQLSPDAPAVDFIVGDEDTPLFSDQAFKEVTDFTEVAVDTYELSVTEADGSEALVSVSDAELEEGDIYTVIVRGYVNSPSGNTNDLSIQIVQH